MITRLFLKLPEARELRSAKVKVFQTCPIYFALICHLTSVTLYQPTLVQAENFSTTLYRENYEADSSSEESLENTHIRVDMGEGAMSKDSDLVHVDFEVHGKVQGVFFRKYTQEEGNKLGLRGFCRNTSAGTVAGAMEGQRQVVEKMKHWLQHTGSPMSRISSAVFLNEKMIDTYSLPQGFDIKRTV